MGLKRFLSTQSNKKIKTKRDKKCIKIPSLVLSTISWAREVQHKDFCKASNEVGNQLCNHAL